MLLDELTGSKTLLPLLKRMMDIASAQHKVSAQNIANVSTPGYRRLEVSFEDNLKRVIQKMREKEEKGNVPTGAEPEEEPSYRVLKTKRKALPGAINNVNLSEEMADIAKNQLYYKFAVNLMRRQLESIRSSISGRSR